jgi:hypothetical protein
VDDGEVHLAGRERQLVGRDVEGDDRGVVDLTGRVRDPNQGAVIGAADRAGLGGLRGEEVRSVAGDDLALRSEVDRTLIEDDDPVLAKGRGPRGVAGRRIGEFRAVVEAERVGVALVGRVGQDVPDVLAVLGLTAVRGSVIVPLSSAAGVEELEGR